MRKLLLLFLALTTGVVFSARLFYLQIYDSSFKKLSENNAIKIEYDYPERGYIFDRNNELMVSNQPAYDIMVIPRNVKAMDTLQFCEALNITKADFIKKLKKAKNYSPRIPSPFIPQLTKKEFAALHEKMYKFKGFYIQKRSLRDYQVDHSANVLGFIGEVNEGIINKQPYYRMGDLIGMSGVEKQYEEILRGVKGVRYIQKDRFNKDIGPYKGGSFDTIPISGTDIVLTLDAKLQEYGTRLMQNKRGGIVAIEPATGEILSLITAPTYDPDRLVGRKRSRNYTELYYDSIAKPLFDRVLEGQYPPGSPFKALTSLIGLQEGVITTDERISCSGGYYYGGKKPLGCHAHRSPLDMVGGIANSCNSYFCTVYRRSIEKYDTPQEGIDSWHDHLASFGLGDYMGYDLPSGRKGYIPDSDFYNRSYQYPKYRWYATATISNAIGQGEVSMTPMQMAHVTSVIANRGWYYKPHIIKSVRGADTIPSLYKEKHYTTINQEYFDPVVEGMFDVYNEGTAKWIQIPGIEICGKTGTAENYTIIDGVRTQLTDHSIFVAFAPKDNPKIAIAVFVENGYWGSRWAGRIAGLMIEKYLKGEITRTDMEDFVLNGSLEQEYAKPLSGEPFTINQ